MKGDIGKIIKFGRQKLGITQEELGTRLGVSKVSIWAWETGKSVPAADMLLKIADQIDIVPELFPRYGKISSEIEEINNRLKKLESSLSKQKAQI